MGLTKSCTDDVGSKSIAYRANGHKQHHPHVIGIEPFSRMVGEVAARREDTHLDA